MNDINDDLAPDEMKLFRVAGRRWADFTEADDFTATLDYEEARPLIWRPAAWRRFLAEHGYQIEKEMI